MPCWRSRAAPTGEVSAGVVATPMMALVLMVRASTVIVRARQRIACLVEGIDSSVSGRHQCERHGDDREESNECRSCRCHQTTRFGIGSGTA